MDELTKDKVFIKRHEDAASGEFFDLAKLDDTEEVEKLKLLPSVSSIKPVTAISREVSKMKKLGENPEIRLEESFHLNYTKDTSIYETTKTKIEEALKKLLPMCIRINIKNFACWRCQNNR